LKVRLSGSGYDGSTGVFFFSNPLAVDLPSSVGLLE
jgi:hypothetical protein